MLLQKASSANTEASRRSTGEEMSGSRFTSNGVGFDFAAALKGCELHDAMLEVMNHQNLEWTEEYAKLEIRVAALTDALKLAQEAMLALVPSFRSTIAKCWCPLFQDLTQGHSAGCLQANTAQRAISKALGE